MTLIQCPSIPSWLKEVDDKDVAAHVAAGWVVVENAQEEIAGTDEEKPKRVKRTRQARPVQEQTSSGDGESN